MKKYVTLTLCLIGSFLFITHAEAHWWDHHHPSNPCDTLTCLTKAGLALCMFKKGYASYDDIVNGGDPNCANSANDLCSQLCTSGTTSFTEGVESAQFSVDCTQFPAAACQPSS